MLRLVFGPWRRSPVMRTSSPVTPKIVASVWDPIDSFDPKRLPLRPPRIVTPAGTLSELNPEKSMSPMMLMTVPGPAGAEVVPAGTQGFEPSFRERYRKRSQRVAAFTKPVVGYCPEPSVATKSQNSLSTRFRCPSTTGDPIAPRAFCTLATRS